MTATSSAGLDLDALPEHLGIYVYGIVGETDPAATDGLAGLDDGPVELVEAGEVAAVVGVITLDRPPGRKKELLAHTRVLDTLATRAAVAPVQFGTVLAAAADVRAELLEGRGPELVELLATLEGRQQFTVKGRYNEQAVLAEIVAEDDEIAVLRERTRDAPEGAAHHDRIRLGELVAHAMERKREQDATVVLDVVLPHVDSYAPRAGAALDYMMEVAFLVEEPRRAAFEDALEAVAEAMHERVRLQLLGPMAPYDFVGH